jgi:hypothetical protein
VIAAPVGDLHAIVSPLLNSVIVRRSIFDLPREERDRSRHDKLSS